MSRAVRGAAFALAGVFVAVTGTAQAQEPPPRPFLRKVIQLDAAQLAAVEKGEVVTKLLPTTEKAEIAAFGVVKTAGTPEAVLRLARDVKGFRQVPQIPEMGLFSSPPKTDDMRGLTHPPDDIAALRKCRPGSCDVKVGTRGLEIAAQFDWKSPGAEARAGALFNQALVDYMTAYARGGTDALGDVLDKKAPKSRSQEYRALLANSTYLVEYVKEFNDYLAAYPNAKLAQTEDVLYWTKDTFGLKPVVSAYHLTLHHGPRGVILANKLLYASHYFNAALEIMAAVPAPDGQGVYLLSLYRTRLDPPTGMLAGILMGKVRDGIETGVRENLKHVRTRLGGR